MQDEYEPHGPDDVIEPPRVEPIPPQNGGGHEPETISDAVRRTRDMIPVGDRGLTPQTYGQWIDIAKDVCKAYLMLPPHLHNNAPVMAGLLEIAARFKLSAYLLASQSYVQNGRLCFQAQAFGAILYASNLLHGRLRFAFNGDGDEMTCTVSGRFKDDLETIYTATTPPVKQIHPGHTQKDGKTFVKGSPLWDRDAEQQLAYFAERRWIRRYAPDACMGMYTREEMIELDQYRAGQQGAIQLSPDRLGQLQTGEGWRAGEHVAFDLAAIEPEPAPEPVLEPLPLRRARQPAVNAPEKPTRGRSPRVRQATPHARRSPSPPPPEPVAVHRSRRAGKAPPARPPSAKTVRAAADRAERPRKVVAAAPPRWLHYVRETEAWIKAISNEELAARAEARWESEHDVRDKARVPMAERSRLRALLDRRIKKHRPPEPPAEDSSQ